MEINPHQTVDGYAGGVLSSIFKQATQLAKIAAIPACVTVPKPLQMPLPSLIPQVDIDLPEVAPPPQLTLITVTIIQTLWNMLTIHQLL